MKKLTRDEQFERCGRKRRYRSEAEALQAAAVMGLERERTAYACEICGRWHLASINPGRGRAPRLNRKSGT